MVIESLLLLAPAIGVTIAATAAIASIYIVASSTYTHFHHRKTH